MNTQNATVTTVETTESALPVELTQPRSVAPITELDIVSKMLSECDANVSALVPVLKTAAKRSNSEYRSYIHAGTKYRKLSSGANKLLGHWEAIRKQLFGYKVQAAKLRDLHASIVKGGTLEQWNADNIPERDKGIKFTVFFDGEESSDALMNGDYAHIRKYCGSAVNTDARTVDNTLDAYMALEAQVQSIIGVTPVNGMTLRIERDSRLVSNLEDAEPRKAESFTFTFCESPTGGMFANVKSDIGVPAKDKGVKTQATFGE